MDGVQFAICFMVLLAAFLLYAFKDRTSHALVLERLSLYMSNNLELKKKIGIAEQSVSDQRSVLMAHALELKELQEKCSSLSGRQSQVHKNMRILEAQGRTTKIDFTVIDPKAKKHLSQ